MLAPFPRRLDQALAELAHVYPTPHRYDAEGTGTIFSKWMIDIAATSPTCSIVREQQIVDADYQEAETVPPKLIETKTNGTKRSNGHQGGEGEDG